MGGKFKVRGHSGAITDDIYHHIMPLIEKRPYIILMIGTNDASTKSADKIVDEILDLKLYIEGFYLIHSLLFPARLQGKTTTKPRKLSLICVRNLLIHMFLLF